ncbi:tautomerase family protein [Hansschlegelia zhihuaiae]|uniref:4-oxalocrotonate tautomerase n=1 Tax=Hansschlegelia zhihuaiae TaxID=405005 RepID=A0A4V1KJ63_9HYPH|nr:tautomerase family protein [Hansschlegelia zhihuaiae]RXF73092.1 4-oxalocrotonate tautomerase [Hansschlegelia zhihuaiae]
MPTYVCWARTGLLSGDQRRRIAQRITEIHHEAGRAPRYFVQVIFSDIAEQSHFIAGEEAERDHIWIRADIRTGRTQEQKAQIMTRIVDDVCAISGASRESVWVYVSDIPGASVTEFGHILPQPGEEEAWFARLPAELQERLRAIA